MAEKVVIELEVDAATGVAEVKSLEKSVNKADDAVKDTTSSVDDLTSSLDNMTGGAVTGFKKLVAGGKTAITTLKSVKLAVAATGIGALVIAVVSLQQAFTSSEEGQNRWAKIMGVVGSLVGNVTDLLADLGNIIIDVFTNPLEYINKFADLIKENITNRFEGLMELIPQLGKAVNALFSGDFAEAGEIAVNAVSKVTLGVEDMTGQIESATVALKQFGEELLSDAELAAEIANKRAEAEKIERDLIVERSEIEAKVAELRLNARKQDEFTLKQRQGFLKEASALQDEILDKETKVLELRRDALIAENTLSDSNKEALTAEAEAIADLNRLERERAQRQIELQEQLTTLTNQVRAEDQAYKDQRLATITEIENATSTANEREIMAVREKYLTLLEEARKFNLSTLELEQQFQEELAALSPQKISREDEITAELEADKRLAEGKMQIVYERNKKEIEADEQRIQAMREMDEIEAKAKLDVAASVANSVAQLAGEQTAIGKAAAIASTTIATYQSATNAFNSLSGIPVVGPALGAVAAAAAVVSGIANVKKILSVKTPGKSGGSGASPSIGGGSNFSAPSVGSSIGLINPVANADGISSGINDSIQNNPPRAYIVAEDVENGLDLDAKIKANGQFG